MAPIWQDVLDQTVQMCTALGRTELARRLAAKRAQLLATTLRVVVIGEPKQGKSQLVNALINAPVCPVGTGLTTAVPTVVHHADAPVAALVTTRADGPAGGARTSLPVAELADRITAPPATHAADACVEVGVPRGLLAAGVVLVDTPGLDEPTEPADPDGAASSVGSPATADVVVMVSDATQELSSTELDRLRRLAHDHPYLILALTKIDIVPQWRLVAERNRQQLAAAGVPAALVPISAALRLRAAQADDQAVNAESGFPDLISRLMRYLRAKRDVLAPTSAGRVVRRVVEQLAEPLREGLSVAEGTSEPLARLHQAQRDLDELRRCSARWQNALSDDMADLRSDLEYDLRDRTRQILREVDRAFEVADPLRGWDEFQSWLDGALVEAAHANFAWLVQRCDWIAGQLSDHFVQYGAGAAPAWRAEPPYALHGGTVAVERPAINRFSPLQKLYAGLRGSYLGVLMFGLPTTLAGLPLLNPISIGAGALFAGKGVLDEGRLLLKRRQEAAKAAAARHVDDFFLLLNKESKDTTRWVQRTLREHYNGLTEQIHDAIVGSLRSAKQAADADVVERDQRHREIQQRLQRLAGLYQRARALTEARAAPAAGLEPAG